MRILLVEDSAVTGSALAELLRLEGHEVEWAMDAKDAWVSLAKSRPPDAIVIDYLLGDASDGLTLLKDIAATARLAVVPTVLMSGVGDAEIEAVAKSQACAVLRKPFNAQELVAVLKTLGEKT